uniref:DUF6794 domain-containing protein n=1 Tax=Flavobacterium sp. TaxID=239 RepID=UPI00404AA974
MKFSIALIFFMFSTITFGQETKSPRNINQAIRKLDKNLTAEIKEKLKNISSDSLLIFYKNSESKFDIMEDWFFRWTQMSTTRDASLGKYYKKKGLEVPYDMIEVVLKTYQNKLNGNKANHDEILKTFQLRQQKNDKEDAIRYTTDSLNGFYIPKDLDDAINSLNKIYSDSVKLEIIKLTEKDYVSGNYRFGIGLWMRNNWKLWRGSRLSKFFEDNRINHPESMSVTILESYYRYLKNEDIRFEEQIKEYLEWEEKIKIDKLELEKKELKEKQETFVELKIGDVLEFKYKYGFSSQSQEDKWMDDICLAKGILIEKDEQNLEIKVKVIECCDRKGILIYNNDNVQIYDNDTKKWTEPKRRIVKYLKKGKSAWFTLDKWDLE